jgi:uncharacterized protein involved in response to NO
MTQGIYAMVLVSALLRIVAAFIGSVPLIEVAGFLWVAAFVCFVLLYGPLLGRHKPAWSGARC